MASSSEKKYGLLDPKAKAKVTVADVFNNDSNSDDERGSRDWIMKKLQNVKEKTLKKQTLIDINRALEEDPTVYQYDEVYDTMKDTEAVASKLRVEKKPKYMSALLKTADNRKKEHERRTQRMIQKERETEGEMFKDKEEFITSAYRDKLEVMKKEEEHEKKMEYIESVMDVTKQKDLGGFYRHLYKETVASGETSAVIDKEYQENVKEEGEIESDSEKKESRKDKKESSSSSDSSSSDSDSSDSSSSDSSQLSLGDAQKVVKSLTKVESNKVKHEAQENIVDKSETESKEDIKQPAEEKEKRPLESKESDVKEPTEKKAKFESASSNRKERNYRQRETSNNRDSPVKERKKSPVRQDSRSKSHRDDRERDRERYRGREKEKDRGREQERRRDRDKKDERRGRNSRDADSKSRESRKQRSRSRDKSRREPEKKLSPLKDKKEVEKNHGERKDKKLPKDEVKVEAKKQTKGEGKEVPVKSDKEQKTEKVSPVEKKSVVEVKVDIWKKRTVGAVFDAALERYYQRKANRGL